MSETRHGRVVSATADEFGVVSGSDHFMCTVRGAKWQTKDGEPSALVVVGDEVLFTPTTEGQGVIEEVLPRRNELGRVREFHAYGRGGRNRGRPRATRRKHEQVLVSNVDQAILVFAASQPRPNFSKIDSFVIGALSENLPAILCVNKMDLAEASFPDSLTYYEKVPVRLLLTSAVSGTGLKDLRAALEGKTSVLWGPSGVGKSTLLNVMFPGLERRVGHVSQATGMGTHTTRSVEMIACAPDTWVIDAPGWRHFTPRTVTRSALDSVLWDVAQYAAECRFADCRHEMEPDCRVREALEKGKLEQRRVDVYRELSHLI